jgi:DNA-binding LacI/PurR family transcriptional regulator
MNKRVTITDVAELAGVSPTSVSFAFNKPEQLNADTVERIRKVAIDMGYVPNPLARALIARRIGAIGLLMPQALSSVLSNSYFHTFLQGVASICDEQALGLLALSPLNGSLDVALTRAPVDGFIITGFNEAHPEVMPLQKRKVPYVVVDGDAVSTSSVNVDDEGGAFAAAEFLLNRGHRDILVLMLETAFGHQDEHVHGVGMRRMNGYQRAFEKARVPWRENWILPSPSTQLGGERGFELAWNGGKRPTAVLAAADAIAVGAVTAAVRHGLAVPRDLEVVGFDNSTIAEMSRPMLSTVHQPIFEKGRSAAELLVAEIEGKGPVRQLSLPTRLVLRDTTRQE